jgi:uncharacterized protein (TIGR03437 family)
VLDSSNAAFVRCVSFPGVSAAHPLFPAAHRNTLATRVASRYHRCVKALLLALALVANLQAGDPARDARWQQDLSYLAAQLPLRHPDFYSLVPQSQFHQAVADLNQAIPTLNDTAVMLGLAKIVAMANDGHTRLFLMQANVLFHLLPLNVQWFADGLFVTGAGAGYERALGARVVQIGDLPTDAAYAAVVPTISHENDIWVRAQSPYYLTNADILQALGIAPAVSPIHFVFRDQAGTQFSLDIAALDFAQYAFTTLLPDPDAGFTPFAQQNTSLYYWFTYVPSSRLLYLAYNVCGNSGSEPFAQLNTRFWAAFDANPVDILVVDLRNNTGGNSSIFDSFLTSRTQRAARLAGVRTYVILGRTTFSSAILAAISLDQPPVRKVGEPTGGSPNMYGEVASFTLPNSKLTVNYSTRYFSYPQYPPGSMLPDINVPLASADYFARHDPFLAAALADARSINPAPPAGPLTVANAATFRTDLPVAPGSIASAFADASILPSADVAGLRLLVNGTPAQVLAASPGQVNFQVPSDAALGPAAFQVEIAGAPAAEGSAPIVASAPGIFIGDPLDPARPAAGAASALVPGDVLRLYGTGVATQFTPKVFFGADEAQVISSQFLPSFPGLWEIDVVVPDAAAVNGQVPVFVAIGNAAGNGVTVRVSR